MRQWIAGLLLMLCGIAGYAKAGVTDDSPLSPEDNELLENAVAMVDKGQSVAAFKDFELLAAKYPKNFVVQYERLYCLYTLERYDEVIKDRKSVLDNKDASDIAYQIIGNAYDIAGKTRQAVKTYEDGLKLFPESGLLYLELGNIYLNKKEYDNALENYNRGIMVQPDFASNYYRAATLYMSSSNMLVWGLVYGESAILLAPSKVDRHEELARMMIDCLKENVHFNYDGETRLKMTLVPSRGMTLDKSSQTVYLAFPGIYEGAIVQPLKKMFDEKIQFTCDLKQLIEIRKGLVETYFSVTDNLYGNSMYLLEFQKQVIDAGHWDAYNYYLFGVCYPEEFERWISSNRRAFEGFADWYNKSPYTLGNGRSVDINQIYNSYKPLSFIESMMIQGKLLTGGDD